MKTDIAKDMLQADGHIKLLLATPAFGMGVNCPDIRRVVHAGVPATLEGEYHLRCSQKVMEQLVYVDG